MKEEKKNILPGIMIIALLAAVSVFFILLNVETNILKSYEKIQCIRTREMVSEGHVVRPEELAMLFEVVYVDQGAVPQGYLVTEEMLAGLQAKRNIPTGSIVTPDMFDVWDEEVAKMKEPVVAGVKAEDLYQVVSGVLRGGDHVDIYTIDGETKEAYLLWEKVLVKDTFDNSGNRILQENQETPAARLNLILEKGAVDHFYELLEQGSLRVVKVWEE